MTVTTSQGARTRWPRDRIAVSSIFLIAGMVVGAWAPKIPEFMARFGLSESQMGLIVLAFGLGSIAAMPMVGYLVARDGSRAPTRLLGAATASALLAITLSPTLQMAVVSVVFAGAVIGGVDVAMNANAVTVEKRMGRAIMSSCHGFWSVGGLIGAATGGFLIGKVGVLGHALVMTGIWAAIIVVTWRWVHDDKVVETGERHPVRLPVSSLPWLLGLVALSSMIPEGAILDWGALYLLDEMGADTFMSGLGFAGFSATMAVMRFLGDDIRDRLGAVRTLRLFGLVAAVGLLIAGMAPGPLTVIFGFAVAGIGIANLVPIVFSAAGSLPGMAPGVALSLVTMLGYSGILLAPSIIGYIAEETGFAPIFMMMPALILVAVAFAPLGRYADGEK